MITINYDSSKKNINL